MRSSKILILVLVLAVGGWYLLSRYEIEGLEQVQIRPKGASSSATSWQPASHPSAGKFDATRTIRIATLNPGPLDAYKIQSPQVATRLSDLVRQFDVIALQDIRDRDHGLLIALVDLVNQAGCNYDFVTDPQVGRVPVKRYLAYLFNSQTVAVDRRAVYSVVDPAGRFECQPLAASFVVLGPPAQQAFTFTLVNVYVAPDRATVELPLLDDVFRAVRRDGRGEDDVIVLGHVAADESMLAELERLSSGAWLLGGIPTSTRGDLLADNLFFDRWATVEYTGRSGVVDVVRRFDLALHEAVATTENLPVWAEFSAFEGGIPGLATAAKQPGAK